MSVLNGDGRILYDAVPFFFAHGSQVNVVPQGVIVILKYKQAVWLHCHSCIAHYKIPIMARHFDDLSATTGSGFFRSLLQTAGSDGAR
jgi:hypothetical protein